MKNSFKHLPQNERKKILLICDDIRVHSGVATIAKEMVINTAQHFNWVNMGGAIKHPDQGKRFDLSKDTNNLSGLNDSSSPPPKNPPNNPPAIPPTTLPTPGTRVPSLAPVAAPDIAPPPLNPILFLRSFYCMPGIV